MTWKEYIENQRQKYIGKRVEYGGSIYTVVDIDYNGAVMIDKKAKFTDTVAIGFPEEINFIG